MIVMTVARLTTVMSGVNECGNKSLAVDKGQTAKGFWM